MATWRSLRSFKKVQQGLNSIETSGEFQACIEFQAGDSETTVICLLPSGSHLPHINGENLRILRAKQTKLQKTHFSIEAELPHHSPCAKALASTLIFAQYEAGTAVCIDPKGLVLTCAHCFGESDVEWRENRYKWLIYYTGQIVLVECKRWDPVKDLALAQIIAVEVGKEKPVPASLTKPVFASVPVSESNRPRSGTPIICIGQPGRDDLESSKARKTTYNLVEISGGSYRGLIPGVDPNDCSQIGTLKHDAWTYWGHSGAPLIQLSDGKLVGLHSSWDDQTMMRHGVPASAIRSFLQKDHEVVDLTGEED